MCVHDSLRLLICGVRLFIDTSISIIYHPIASYSCHIHFQNKHTHTPHIYFQQSINKNTTIVRRVRTAHTWSTRQQCDVINNVLYYFFPFFFFSVSVLWLKFSHPLCFDRCWLVRFIFSFFYIQFIFRILFIDRMVFFLVPKHVTMLPFTSAHKFTAHRAIVLFIFISTNINTKTTTLTRVIAVRQR